MERVKNSEVTDEDTHDYTDPEINCDHLDISTLVDTINIAVDSTSLPA